MFYINLVYISESLKTRMSRKKMLNTEQTLFYGMLWWKNMLLIFCFKKNANRFNLLLSTIITVLHIYQHGVLSHFLPILKEDRKVEEERGERVQGMNLGQTWSCITLNVHRVMALTPVTFETDVEWRSDVKATSRYHCNGQIDTALWVTSAECLVWYSDGWQVLLCSRGFW